MIGCRYELSLRFVLSLSFMFAFIIIFKIYFIFLVASGIKPTSTTVALEMGAECACWQEAR